MASTIQQLVDKKLIVGLSEWLIPNNVVYETITGSVAYGISADTSDYDVIGIAIPPKDYIFPNLKNKIFGFDEYEYNVERLKPYINKTADPSAMGGYGRTYDLHYHHIVHFFNLLISGNPHCLDAIWTPQNCVVYCTRVGHMIRDNRKVFLHKGIWDTFRSYAFSQLKKIRTKTHAGLPEVVAFEEEHKIPCTMTFELLQQHMKEKNVNELGGLNNTELEEYYKRFERMVTGSKRAQGVKIQGFDLKFSYNLARLLDEIEQLLLTGDMDLQKGREYYKAIRRGDVPLDDIEKYMNAKDQHLQVAYGKTELPDIPNRAKIHRLLVNCLEEQYGDLSKCGVTDPDASTLALQEFIALAERAKGLISK